LLKTTSKEIEITGREFKATNLIWATVLLAISMTIGQILLKKAAMSVGVITDIRSLIDAMLSPWMLSALAIYISAVVYYTYILQRMPLTQAYILLLAAPLFVPLGAWLVFKEPISSRYLLGFVFVVSGLLLARS